MFQKLVSHNDDLRRLVEKGYAVAFDSGHLIIRDVPYLDASCQLQIGAIVSKMEFVNQTKVIQQDHQIFFAGGIPHGIDGGQIPNLGGGSASLVLTPLCDDIVVQRSFSNKPRASGKFEDFFEKIESYIGIISGPAMELYKETPYTFRVAKEVGSEGIFKFQDTMTSRAEISGLSSKFIEDVVAIIGLGGTGSYLLDFLVKTPVREIRAFDLDAFHVHNAFRSPGQLLPTELGQSKASVYADRYKNFRLGLNVSEKFMDDSCSEELDGVTFAFVCVDRGSSRSAIFDILLSKGIPFIDVGMGLKKTDSGLSGMLRTTYYSSDDGKKVRELGLAELIDGPNDVYRSNIQISELNALNASLAVIKFKQLRGFYSDDASQYHLLFGIDDLKTACCEWESNEN